LQKLTDLLFELIVNGIIYLACWVYISRIIGHANQAMQAVLSCKGLTKNFAPGLRKLSFSIGPGQVWGVLGANGLGKTTLLRIMAGLMIPDEGEVQLPRFSDNRGYKSYVGYCPAQSQFVSVVSTFRDQVDLFSRLWGVKVNPSFQNQILELMQLCDFQTESIFKLSSGYRKRAALALTVLLGAKIFIFDEPESHLDEDGLGRLNQLIAYYLHLFPDTSFVLGSPRLNYLQCTHLLELK
jgi:ABC-type multidrug transport system ATPase subunit